MNVCTDFEPLSSPEPSFGLTATKAMGFPAVQLFVERATAIVEDFVLNDANAPLVGAICRKLDGLPLAIEFTVPRVQVLGVEGLAHSLDDRLRLSGAWRRAATARHQTMRAVLDWSYSLLSECEQGSFRALGIFTGGFTVEAAAAVAMDATGVSAIDRLADLVAKSLVVADVSGVKPRFRLLDTTRVYAVELLGTSGERRTDRTPARRVLPHAFRIRRSGSADANDRQLAGGLCPRTRQFAGGARLGILAWRRAIDRCGAGGCGTPALDSLIAARRVL